MNKNNNNQNNQNDLDVEDILNGTSTVKEVEEIFDKTEVLVSSIDAFTRKDHIEALGKQIESLNQSRMEALKQTFVQNPAQKVFDTFNETLKVYSEEEGEEEDIIEERFSLLFGSDKDEKEENSELAYEQATKLLNRIEEFEYKRKKRTLDEIEKEQEVLTQILRDLISKNGDKEELIKAIRKVLKEIS